MVWCAVGAQSHGVSVLQVDTRPKKKKAKAKKANDEDEFAIDEPKKKSKGGKKGSSKAEAQAGLPMAAVGAALAVVAGAAVYFSMQ